MPLVAGTSSPSGRARRPEPRACRWTLVLGVRRSTSHTSRRASRQGHCSSSSSRPTPPATGVRGTCTRPARPAGRPRARA